MVAEHLTKFQCLRPGAVVVGQLPDGVPVYLREDVMLLHTRERWPRDGKEVKVCLLPFIF